MARIATVDKMVGPAIFFVRQAASFVSATTFWSMAASLSGSIKRQRICNLRVAAGAIST